MKQVFVSGKGEIEVFDVPIPGRLPNSVLVQNAFSLISSGTESAVVSRRGGWLGAIEKALQKKERIRQAWNMTLSEGIPKTWETINRKLEDYSPLGYSSVGMVIEIDSQNTILRPGMLVSCMGGGVATHSNFVAAPLNLIAPIPDGVRYKEAAFGALGCIAIQGIRRLELGPGELVVVLGLGLLGQLTTQLLTAMGYRAAGIDLLPERAAKASEITGIETWGGQEMERSQQRVEDLTNGHGADGVIVCAASVSDEPINLAFDLCRKRGRVSLVGDVGLKLLRSKMYAKELDLRISCSYGPGRYDSEYEFSGRDYPFGYVRWTEKRNLEYFLELLAKGRLRISSLISRCYPVDQAPSAYTELKENKSDIYGILLDYGPLPDKPEPPSPEEFIVRHEKKAPTPGKVTLTSEKVRLGIIGCGSFVKNVHLPNLKRLRNDFHIAGLSSATGATAEIMARKEGIPIASSDYRVLLDDPEIDAVLVATRHKTHARITLDALNAGKHVFVEKPMCINIKEGEEIVAKAEENGLIVRVGFNRRFSPYLGLLREVIGTNGQRMFYCRVNIGSIQNDWSNTAEEGGRLLGEGVHFLDLCNWFADGLPSKITASICGESVVTNPNAMFQIEYDNGFMAQVVYTSFGEPKAGKEYFEVFGNGRTAICDDYKSIKIFGSKVVGSKKHRGDKGHLAAVEEFASVIQGRKYPIKGADAWAGLLATQMVMKAYTASKI